MCVAAAIAGGAIIGGIATTVAANKGAKAQTQAANIASNTELSQYNQTREDMAPYRQIGYQALNSLGTGLNLSGPTSAGNAPAFVGQPQNSGSRNSQQLIPSGGQLDYNQYLDSLRNVEINSIDGDGNPVKIKQGQTANIQDDVNYRRSYLQYLNSKGVNTSQGAAQFISTSPQPNTNAPKQEFLGGSATNPGEFLTNFDPSGSKYQDQVASRGDFDPSGSLYKSTVADPYGKFNFNFEADPGYQFRLDEGQKALERSASARGGVLNGGVLKAISRYGQDFASNEYDKAYGRNYGEFQNDRGLALSRYGDLESQFGANRGFAADQYSNQYNRFNNDTTQRFSRLSAVAGIGQTANNTTAQLGAQTAGNVANNQLAVGNANAARYAATGNAIGAGANTVANYYALRNLYGVAA